MWGVVACWVTGCLLIPDASAADLLYRSGRRICSSGGQTGFVPVTQSFVQPVYKPLITMCEGHRACSTYRTTYKISYRQVSKKPPLFTCCPGWRRTDARSCDKGDCRLPCQNEGTCVGYNRCRCSEGWSGDHCQTDVNECEGGRHGCSQSCINTSGSFRCGCNNGFSLSDNGKSCRRVEDPAPPAPPQPSPSGTGDAETVRREVQELRSKIEVLEQKLQLVLVPFHGQSTVSPEDSPGPVTFLTHSLRQLDRIDSLSEQISFLEERLETCSCKNDL